MTEMQLEISNSDTQLTISYKEASFLNTSGHSRRSKGRTEYDEISEGDEDEEGGKRAVWVIRETDTKRERGRERRQRHTSEDHLLRSNPKKIR
jgi:hypothetical protein